MRSSFVALVLAGVACLLAAAACLAFPLTSNPGPESAQVLGVAGGLALCLAQAARSSSRSQQGFLADATAGLFLAVGMILVFIIVTAIGGAVHPSCSASRGYLPFFFLALPVLVLQVAVGTWIGRLLARPLRATIGALIFEIGMATWLFFSWYRAPTFRIVSHLFIVVSGDLLRGAAMPAIVIGYRAATFLFAVALLCAGGARFPRIRRTGLSQISMGAPALYALGAAALVVGIVAHALTADEIAPKRSDLDAQYTLVKKRGLLVVHADPLAVRPKDVDAMLAEGTLWLDRIATRLGEKPQEEIDVYVHASREAMEHWTGAAHVDFTLPWRHEIHVVGAEVPHHTLGHELAHAVAGDLSTNLLHIPASFVVFQNSGIIEGLAVALTPELSQSDGLTLKEQAAAMKRAGFAPDTAKLFRGFNFVEESPARAYVAAGAFIESLVAKSLPDPTHALAELYRTGSLDDAMGGKANAAALVVEHDAMLDALPLPPDAALMAHARFAKPSILRDVCQPDDKEHARELRALTRTGDVDKALASLPEHVERSTLEDLLVDTREIDDPEGLAAVGARLDALPDPVDADDRTDELGDALWAAGKTRDAVASWDRAKIESLNVDRQRTLLAKRLLSDAVVTLADQAPVSRAALDAILARTPAVVIASFERLSYSLGVDDSLPPEQRVEPRAAVSLARYIDARRLVHSGALADGVRAFRAVIDDKLVPPVFLEQSRMGLATALAKSGAAAEGSTLLIAAADDAERPAMRLILRDRAERAARAAAAPEKPARVTATSDPAWADRLLLGVDVDGEL